MADIGDLVRWALEYFIILVYGIGWSAFIMCAWRGPFAVKTWEHSLLMATILAVWPVGLLSGALFAMRNDE